MVMKVVKISIEIGRKIVRETLFDSANYSILTGISVLVAEIIRRGRLVAVVGLAALAVR